MATLPIPGADCDNWGTKLNEFLSVCHNPDGTIKAECAGGGGGGSPSFAGSHGTYPIIDSPEFLTVDSFSATSSAFTTSGGFAQITGPGMYQITAFCQITFTDIPVDEEAWMYLWFYDATDLQVGWSIEQPNAQTPNNRVWFPDGINRFHWLQRVYPISLTSAANFPITIKPEATTTDDDNLRIEMHSISGFRVGEPLAAALSN